MFTGIVKGLFPVLDIQRQTGLLKYSVWFSDTSGFLEGLEIGASIAVNGVCQSVVKIEKHTRESLPGSKVWFDAIQETLDRTTLDSLIPGAKANVERSARFSDEIGGHVLSGHVFGVAQIVEILEKENNKKMVFQCPSAWMKYFFSKGFIAVDGASLTLVDVERESGRFSVHLIPETLRSTTFGFKKVGDQVNIELDAQTQAIVETVERVLESWPRR